MKMRFITIIAFLLSIQCFSGPYNYRGKSITEKQLKKMYEHFKENMYYFGQIVYNFKAGHEQYVWANTVDEVDNGYLSGTVSQIISENKILLYTHDKIVYINGIDTSNLIDDKEITIPVTRSGYIEYSTVLGTNKRVPSYFILPQITLELFAQYLNDGNILYVYQKKVTKPRKCPTCKGTGTIRNLHKKWDESLEKCPDCNGRGKVGHEETTWVKRKIK